MIAYPNPDDPHQDADRVRKFFDEWEVYRKIVDLNYLHHNEAYASISQALTEIEGPFSFLDLGAGDADATTRVLSAFRLKHYEAVDLSEIALNLASKHAEVLICPKRFTQADFFQYVRGVPVPFDVVFVGLSLHHLPLADKGKFFSDIRHILAEGGRFMFYEPICESGESREAVLARWWEVASEWRGLTDEELQKAKIHVFENDYPESVQEFSTLSKKAGFSSTRVLYTDTDNLYAVFECRA